MRFDLTHFYVCTDLLIGGLPPNVDGKEDSGSNKHGSEDHGEYVSRHRMVFDICIQISLNHPNESSLINWVDET